MGAMRRRRIKTKASLMKNPMTNANVPNRTLYTADNLFVLRSINDETIDLIYLDPPFNTGREWVDPMQSDIKFEDTWCWSDEHEDLRWELRRFDPKIVALIDALKEVNGDAWRAYLTYMGIRLLEMYRVLKPTGSIYFHCDPTMSHGIKLIMDAIFGRKNFRNEIVWCYTGPSRATKHFPRKHDVILFYVKSDKAKFYRDAVRVPYKSGIGIGKGGKADKIFRDGDNVERINELLRIGKVPYDWFADDHLTNISAWKKERTGYPTQKPLALLKRFINASSNKGDVVLDPFCGCATACVAADSLERKWIGIDISDKAAGLLLNRLYKINPSSKKRQLEYLPLNWVYHNRSDNALVKAVNESISQWKEKAETETDSKWVKLYKEIHARMKTYSDGKEVNRHLPTRTDLPALRDKRWIKRDKYAARSGLCIICEKEKDILDMEIDHIVPKAKGGQNTEGNFQVICQHCNKIRGPRPMAWVAREVHKREMKEKKKRFSTSMDNAE